MRRLYDATRLNEIVNSPTVRPWAGPTALGELDLSVRVRDPRNVLLLTDDDLGAVFFEQIELGTYEVHIQFMPEGRGALALRAVRDSLHYMFTRTEAMQLYTKIPKNNEPAGAMARAISGNFEFNCGELNGHVVEYWALRYHGWLRAAPGLVERGEWFHDRVNAEARRIGLALPPHSAECPFHDRAAGATVDMILAGQVDKGVILYNAWAKLAGFPTISLVSRLPLIIDVGDMLVAIEDDDFVVIPAEGK